MPSVANSQRMPTKGYQPMPAPEPEEKHGHRQDNGEPAADTMVASPIMISSLPSVASTSDQFSRQFYGGSVLPQRRTLPALPVQTTVVENTTVDNSTTNNTTTVKTGTLVMVQNDVTSERVANANYVNGPDPIIVSGWFRTGGGGIGELNCLVAAPGSGATEIWGNTFTATENNGKAGFNFPVAAGYSYQIQTSGVIDAGSYIWNESSFSIDNS